MTEFKITIPLELCTKQTAEIARLRTEITRLRADAERFAYLYSGTKTESNALIEIELRMLSGDIPSLDEVRAAVDECMANVAKDGGGG